MTPAELLRECQRVTEQGLSHMVLTIPPRRVRGERVRVLPGVLGELCCVNSENRIVVRVAIADVVRWLERTVGVDSLG